MKRSQRTKALKLKFMQNILKCLLFIQKNSSKPPPVRTLPRTHIFQAFLLCQIAKQFGQGLLLKVSCFFIEHFITFKKLLFSFKIVWNLVWFYRSKKRKFTVVEDSEWWKCENKDALNACHVINNFGYWE